MRIFIAGGTGVLGRRIIPILLADGHDVVGLARSDSSARILGDLGAGVARGDALDAEETSAAVAEAGPDVVMHQLTDLVTGDPSRNAELRRVGSRNLADAAIEAGVGRFVAQSISWAYAPGEGPATEDVPLDLDAEDPRGLSVAAIHTLESEAARLPEWVTLRYGMLYGPDTWFAVGGAQAMRASAGRLTAGADITSFVHVDDAARAAVAALEWPTGAINVCDDVPAAGQDWVPAFCDAVGTSAPPNDDAPRPPFARGADNTRLRRNRGFDLHWPDWHDGFSALDT